MKHFIVEYWFEDQFGIDDYDTIEVKAADEEKAVEQSKNILRGVRGIHVVPSLGFTIDALRDYAVYLVKELNYSIYAPEDYMYRNISWFYVESPEGIGYIQSNYSDIELYTVHPPTRSLGSGYKLYAGPLKGAKEYTEHLFKDYSDLTHIMGFNSNIKRFKTFKEFNATQNILEYSNITHYIATGVPIHKTSILITDL